MTKELEKIMSLLPEIEEKDWLDNGVEPWNPTDDEDCGGRTCPACLGEADMSSDDIDCHTCGNTGDVQWSTLWCESCGAEMPHPLEKKYTWNRVGAGYNPDFRAVCDKCRDEEDGFEAVTDLASLEAIFFEADSGYKGHPIVRLKDNRHKFFILMVDKFIDTQFFILRTPKEFRKSESELPSRFYIAEPEIDGAIAPLGLKPIDPADLVFTNRYRKKYYVLISTYVGPNTRDGNHPRPEEEKYLTIQTAPGHKNLSGEICTEGWLGTTDDYSLEACGEFDTLESARQYADEEGFTEDDEDRWLIEFEEEVVEVRITPEMQADQLDAGDWFSGTDIETAVKELNLPKIVSSTPDDELGTIAAAIDEDAYDNYDTVLHGTEKALIEYRNELKDDALCEIAINIEEKENER